MVRVLVAQNKRAQSESADRADASLSGFLRGANLINVGEQHEAIDTLDAGAGRQVLAVGYFLQRDDHVIDFGVEAAAT